MAVRCLFCITFAFVLFPSYSAADVIRLSMSGSFDSNIGSGHPTVNIGDTFELSIVVDDSNISGAPNAQIEINSIRSEELRVNGLPVALGAPLPFLGLLPASAGAPNGGIFITVPAVSLNTFGLNSQGYSGPTVGPTAEFSDLLLFGGQTVSSGNVGVLGGATSGSAITSSQVSFAVAAVPEPSLVSLMITTISCMTLTRRGRRPGTIGRGAKAEKLKAHSQAM